MKLSLSLFIPKEDRLPKTWILFFVVNFFIMAIIRYRELPMPVSLFVEVFYFACIVAVLADSKYRMNVGRMTCAMLGLYAPWLVYSILEIGNMSSEIEFGTIITRWFAEVRTMGFQVVYGMLICAAIFVRKGQIKTMYKIWGICVIICTLKTLMQQYIGFDRAEMIFLETARNTHFVNGIIRYFSLFSDAANHGCNMAATAVVFGAAMLSTKLKREKIFFGIVALCALYSMLASGTRTSIFVLAAGMLTYAAVSKRTQALVITIILGVTIFGFLKFTTIGEGNSMIRRMRSAFNKEDASIEVREMNKMAMRNYIRELPLGLGAGLRSGDVPPSNKNYYLSVVAPDSTWVYVNIHYGDIGMYIFLFSFIGIIGYGGYIVFFRIRDPELRGLLAGLTSGSAAMCLAGYANQIQLQFPNCFLFFGQMMIVFLGPDIDRRIMEAQQEKDRKALAQAGLSGGADNNGEGAGGHVASSTAESELTGTADETVDRTADGTIGRTADGTVDKTAENTGRKADTILPRLSEAKMGPSALDLAKERQKPRLG